MQSRDTIILPAVSGAGHTLKKPSTRFVVINGLNGVFLISSDEIRAIETHLKLEMEAFFGAEGATADNSRHDGSK